ncbi:MAG: hypothetical protein AAGE65_03535 [Planctomycetota bacterium]
MSLKPLWSRISSFHAALLAVACFAAFVVSLPGCTSQQVAEWKAAAQQARTQSAALDPVIADLETDLAEAEVQGGDAEVLAPLQDALTKARERKAEIDALADDYLARIDGVDDPAALVGQGLQVSAPLIPQPWGTAAGVLGAALVTFTEWRRRQTEAAAESVVLSIEGAKHETGGVIDFGKSEHRVAVRTRQSEAARKLVDQAQAKAGGSIGFIQAAEPLKPAATAN